MTDNNIEFVDGDYGQCVERRPARQIRTRFLSFQNIKAKFNDFRLRRLQGKLDKNIEKALTATYTENDYEDKISKSAGVIARLEEKIKVLSREDVPTDYVSRRAIKLRDSMMKNLRFHTVTRNDALYRIGLEHRDAVLADAVVSDSREENKPMENIYSNSSDVIRPVVGDDDVIRRVLDSPEAAAAIPGEVSSSEDISVDSVDRQSIVDAVNESFARANGGEVTDLPAETSTVSDSDAVNVSEVETTSRESIRDIVDAALRGVQEANVDETEVTDNNDGAISTEEKVPVVEGDMPVVGTDENALNDSYVQRPKKYRYIPMTDEEIRESQIKLGFDEHGNIVNHEYVFQDSAPVVDDTSLFDGLGASKQVVEGEVNSEQVQEMPTGEGVILPTGDVDSSVSSEDQVRDNPVVVVDRAEGSSVGLGDDQAMFDIIPQDEKVSTETVTTDSSRPMSIEDYESLKQRILALQDKRAVSQEQKREAEERARQAAKEAEEAKAAHAASQESYLERMRELRKYAEALAADCDENARAIKEAEKQSQISQGIVDSERAAADRTAQIVSEIDSMMGDSSEIEENKPVKKV